MHRQGRRQHVAHRAAREPIQERSNEHPITLQCVSKDAATTGGVSSRSRRERDAGPQPWAVIRVVSSTRGSSLCDRSFLACVCSPPPAAAKIRSHQRRPRTQAWGRPKQRREVARRCRSAVRSLQLPMFRHLRPTRLLRVSATHLGQFTGTLAAEVTSENTSTGTFNFTAANGDQLSGTFVGIEGVFIPPNTARITEVATIENGTGRFAGATGTFTMVRFDYIDFATGKATGTGTFEGQINLNK